MSNQFTRGTTFGAQIASAQELYDLIEKAAATPALISDLPQDTPASGDFLLMLQIASGLLRKMTVQSVSSLFLPTGIELPYGGTAAPDGWILAYGQAIGRAAYPGLFNLYNAQGLPYGAGDGSTTFNVPDYRGRTPFGKDDMGGTAAGRLSNALTGGIDGLTLGATGGESGHALTIAELAAHGHSLGGAAVTALTCNGSTAGGGSGSRVSSISLSNGGNYSNNDSPSGIGANSANTGSGNAHNNLPPGIVRNWIIKA
jgi:microcystin-dependent protein